MSKSEAVVIESIEVREMLRFLFYLDILNKLLLLQRKHSKYMYAKCLIFPCFITYLVACMHAFCMFYLYVSLGFSLPAEKASFWSLVLAPTTAARRLAGLGLNICIYERNAKIGVLSQDEPLKNILPPEKAWKVLTCFWSMNAFRIWTSIKE